MLRIMSFCVGVGREGSREVIMSLIIDGDGAVDWCVEDLVFF